MTAGADAASSRNGTSRAPRVTEMRVVPVAGRDSMLLNLSAAHGPYFTRNLVVLRDAVAMQLLVPGWRFDAKRPCLVR
jgi:glucarate dehydratase